MTVREKYYRLVERYLSHPALGFANKSNFLKFWSWYYRHKDEFTDDEKDFFKKYVKIPKIFSNISDDVYIYK